MTSAGGSFLLPLRSQQHRLTTSTSTNVMNTTATISMMTTGSDDDSIGANCISSESLPYSFSTVQLYTPKCCRLLFGMISVDRTPSGEWFSSIVCSFSPLTSSPLYVQITCFAFGIATASHWICELSFTEPYCWRGDRIVGGPLSWTAAVASMSGKPRTLALQLYRPAVSRVAISVMFALLDTIRPDSSCTQRISGGGLPSTSQASVTFRSRSVSTDWGRVTSAGFASARHDSRTSAPSGMRPPASAPPTTLTLTFGAYFTSSLSRTDRYVRSAVFCAWQVKDVLWCSFFGVSFRIDFAVKRPVSPIGSFTYSMPLVSTVPCPSIQVISAAGLPPTDTHSSSISLSSVVTRKSPCTIFGGSGGTNTVSVAKLDLMPGVPAGEGTRSKPLRFRCHPSPKSSFVHWSWPTFDSTRHGSVTRDPTIAVWFCGSIANFCTPPPPPPPPLLLLLLLPALAVAPCCCCVCARSSVVLVGRSRRSRVGYRPRCISECFSTAVYQSGPATKQNKKM
uniref:Uncharacterized protein n=1 Tax=Anopheles merus TaxID=30066 RepID=A0A182V7F7_ANOME